LQVIQGRQDYTGYDGSDCSHLVGLKAAEEIILERTIMQEELYPLGCLLIQNPELE